MHSLARTFSGKTSQYSPDGCGRDLYIIHNNGGVYKKPGFSSFSNENSPSKRNYSMPQPKMEAKFVKYNTDGTGRDAYIHVNSGGLFYQYGPKAPFHTTLRKWSPIKLISDNDTYYKTQKMWNLQRAKKNSEQEELTIRLSAPKRRNKIESFGINHLGKSKTPLPKLSQIMGIKS